MAICTANRAKTQKRKPTFSPKICASTKPLAILFFYLLIHLSMKKLLTIAAASLLLLAAGACTRHACPGVGKTKATQQHTRIA